MEDLATYKTLFLLLYVIKYNDRNTQCTCTV